MNPAAEFLDLACLTYGDDSPERVARASAMVAADPTLASRNVYTAAATANLEALTKIGLDGRRSHRRGGPRRWPPLLYLCYSRVDGVAGADAVAAARALLDSGADPNSHYRWGGTYRFTALTGAIGEGEGGVVNQPPHSRARELAELLLAAGADPNDAQGLYNTCFRADNGWLRLLLEHGLTPADRINWKAPNRIGTLDFMLGHAVTKGYAERVALCLANGADAAGASFYNQRSHHENALLNGFPQLAATLVAAGAGPAQLSDADRFRAACLATDRVSARSLLRDKPVLLKEGGVLHAAASLSNAPAIALLIELGADVDERDKEGTTPLHQAAWKGDMAAARALVGAGAQPLRDRVHESTPCGWADYAGNREMRDYLLEACPEGLDLVLFGRVEGLESYLGTAPEFATATYHGAETALHRLHDDIDSLEQIVAVLLSAGSDVEARDRRGRTPRESAKRRGQGRVAALLQSAERS